jgi:hypothetical protein
LRLAHLSVTSGKVRFAFTQNKLDLLLQDIVNKHPCIYRIELLPVDKTLNAEQMQEAAEFAQLELKALMEDAKQFVAEIEVPEAN